MSNRPTRPTDYYPTRDGTMTPERPPETTSGPWWLRDEANSYMDAIEQERDEAVRLLRGIMTGAIGRIRTYDEEEFAYKDEVTSFLARIEGADNDYE